MAPAKYDPELAHRAVKLERSEQGDSRNIRILMARGLKHEVALRVVRAIRAGTVSDPDGYAWAVVGDERNLDSKYLAWRESVAFDPAYWAAVQDESQAANAYTTPIRKRLRQRAIAREEELRIAAVAEMDETDYFWRERSRYPNTGSVTSPGSSRPYPQRHPR